MGYRAEREKVLPTTQAIILSSMMVAVGIICIYDQVQTSNNTGGELNWYYLISKVVLIICGLIPLVYKRRSNYFAIGMYAIGLGLGRSIRSLPQLVSSEDIIFLYGLVMFLLGLNLAYSGINYLTIRTRNPSTMLKTAFLMCVIYMLILVASQYTDFKFDQMLIPTIEVVCYVLLYASFICVLLSKSVTETTPYGHINVSLNDIALNSYVGNKITLNEDDISLLKEGLQEPCPWEPLDIGGIDVRERCIKIDTDGFEKFMIIQNWSDRKGLSLTIIPDIDDSFVSSTRLFITDIAENDDSITIYSEDKFIGTIYRRSADGKE